MKAYTVKPNEEAGGPHSKFKVGASGVCYSQRFTGQSSIKSLMVDVAVVNVLIVFSL